MFCKHIPCLSIVVIIKGKSALFAVIKTLTCHRKFCEDFFPVTFFSILLNVWTSNNLRAVRCLAQLPKSAKYNFIELLAVFRTEKLKKNSTLFLYGPQTTFCGYSLHAPNLCSHIPPALHYGILARVFSFCSLNIDYVCLFSTSTEWCNSRSICCQQ